ncbi:MAG: mannose-6-phosphate isomerase, class I [Bacteroidetes bacterium]|nr:mannose-6-phosphate isomerase, class I [Bacteroidota bacterium]
MPGIFRLKGQIKHYDWGGMNFLPDLLGLSNTAHRPHAEYWMGIHPQGPAQLLSPAGETCMLSKLAPQLPFLLKILDVRDMLSIQVHPTRAMAGADFERENQLGIPLDAPTRNYKDPNHKPELMVALSEFWLLHGFRSPNSLKEIFSKHLFLHPLQHQWEKNGYAGLYRWVMELPQPDVNQLLEAPLRKMMDAYGLGKLSKSDPCFWAARAHQTFSQTGRIDRGIFSIFLFNLVRLEKGQGIFQGAGVPHAYLEGQNVEIMANSDNVLRGGLTPKHIDVPELLRHVRTDSVEPHILEPVADQTGKRHYPAPVRDFCIDSIALKPGESYPYRADRAGVVLLVEGQLQLEGENEGLTLGKPELSAFVPSGAFVVLRAHTPSLVFIASSLQEENL